MRSVGVKSVTVKSVQCGAERCQANLETVVEYAIPRIGRRSMPPPLTRCGFPEQQGCAHCSPGSWTLNRDWGIIFPAKEYALLLVPVITKTQTEESNLTMITFKQKHCFPLSWVQVLASDGCRQCRVYVNHDGSRQRCWFIPLRLRDGVATLLSVVNTTNNAKIVKVRFLEGKELPRNWTNLFLSPFDVWTGAVLPTAGCCCRPAARLHCSDPLGGGMLVTG